MSDAEGRQSSEAGEALVSEADQRERRLAALRALAEQATPAADSVRESGAAGSSATPSHLRRPARPRRRTIVLSAVLIAVLLIAGVGVYQLTRPKSTPAPTIPAALTIDLGKDHLACPTGMEWSPDGTRLALLASTGRCNSPSDQDISVLAIYDGAMGKLVRHTETDSMLPSFGLKGRVGTPHWSPDGRAIILDAVIFPESKTSTTFTLGLLVLPAEDGSVRLIQGPTYDVTTARSLPVPIWDVANGTSASVLPPSLPLALTYRWTTDGQIVADQPMPSGPATGAATAGSAGLTRWHSGTLEYLPAVDSTGNPVPHQPPVAWFLASSIPTWSPDGHYFTELLLSTRLVAAGSPAAPITTGFCANAQFTFYAPVCSQVGITPSDAALGAALASAQAGHELTDSQGNSYGTGWTSVSVDWRPDGKVLAALLPGDGFVDQNSTINAVRVTLLDASSGKSLTTLTANRPNPNGSSTTPGVPYTAWSPNGQQLALVDYFSSRITVWGGASLSALPK